MVSFDIYILFCSPNKCTEMYYKIVVTIMLQMQFMLLFSRQGKLRLQKWYVAHPDKLKKKITRELITTILARKPKMSSFLEWKDVKVVYKRYMYAIDNRCFNLWYVWTIFSISKILFTCRYASLYFCCAIEQNDNELLTLEIIHRYVELLDKYFGSVSIFIKIRDLKYIFI